MPIRTPLAATVAALFATLVPALPAAAALPATGRPVTGADDARSCGNARFTADTQADLAKITVLDAGLLHPGLPALADVRLAAANGTVDSSARGYRSVATAATADARLLGLKVPLPTAEADAPSNHEGPVQTTLAAVNAGGLATVEVGKNTAEAGWNDKYLCGKTGPLTRSATMLEGASLLGGSGQLPAMQALAKLGAQPARTDLLRIGPTGSTQSAADVVHLKDGRSGISAAAGVSLGDITLFGGTPQEISIKVKSQPTLTVVAGGDGDHSTVDYRPAILRVTAAGRPAVTLDTDNTSLGLSLLGNVAGDITPSLLGVRLSLGGLRQSKSGAGVRAEAAALRVEVTLGNSHLLDVALGYLYADASTTVICATGDGDSGPTHPGKPTHTPTHEPTRGHPGYPSSTTPVSTPIHTPPHSPTATASTTIAAESGPQGGSGGGTGPALALTGANVTAAAAISLALIIAGAAALAFTRRRRQN